MLITPSRKSQRPYKVYKYMYVYDQRDELSRLSHYICLPVRLSVYT